MSTGHYGETPINQYELQSVRALISWAARENELSQETVSEIVKTKFNAPEITSLRQKDYENLIYFLVDIQLEMILN